MSPTHSDLHPHHARSVLRPFPGAGLFITATGTDVGKTTVTAALAGALHRLHVRVGICKPIAAGCPKFAHRGNDPEAPLSDDDYVPVDAQVAARAVGLDPDDETLLAYLAPLRFGAPIAPHLAAAVENRTPDWRRVAAAMDWWQENCDVLLVEGAGGWYVPLDSHDFMIADLAAALRLPVLVVTEPSLGTLNATLLTTHAIREKKLAVAGLVINRVPTLQERDLAVITNLDELPRLTGVPVRAELPKGPAFTENVPTAFIDAMMPFAKEWLATMPSRA